MEAIVNRAAADGQTAIIGAWGAAPTSIKNQRSRKWRNRRFCAFGSTNALLAASKECLFIRGVHVQHKSRKQCVWRAICEKRSFPLRRIWAFSACWGTAPNPVNKNLFWVTLPFGQRLRNLQLLSEDQMTICIPEIISALYHGGWYNAEIMSETICVRNAPIHLSNHD